MIPGQENKVLHAVWCGHKIKKHKNLIEENTGRRLYDINHNKILYDPPPRVMKIKIGRANLPESLVEFILAE